MNNLPIPEAPPSQNTAELKRTKLGALIYKVIISGKAISKNRSAVIAFYITAVVLLLTLWALKPIIIDVLETFGISIG